MNPKHPQEIQKQLGKQIQGEVCGDEVHRALYSTAACIYRLKPLAVAYPRDVADVVRIVRYASQENIPLTARGAGTGLAGQSLGTGLIVDFSRHMRRILEADCAGERARFQPGTVLGDLNRTLNRGGCFFPPDPSSGHYCTLGGMIANNSSGAHSVKYGATKDYLLSLELVLADGSVVRTGSGGRGGDETTGENLARGIGRIVSGSRSLIEEKAPRATKNSSGYNLRQALGENDVDLNYLIAGSEGTLGLVTEATVRIVRLPPFRSTVLLYFAELEPAAESIPEICALEPSVLELMDRTFIDLVRRGSLALREALPDSARVLFLVEFEGQTPAEAREKVHLLQRRIIEELRLAFAFRHALEPQEQERLWAIRQAASPLLDRLEGPGKPARFIEDVAVEPARLPEYIRGLRRILDRQGAPGIIFGHAGDGNIHVNPLLDLRTEKGIRQLEEIAAETYELARSLGGTLSGEHGDGRLRTPFLPSMYGELCEVFRRVKEAFDPGYLLNPGVIVSVPSPGGIAQHLRFGPENAKRNRIPLLGRHHLEGEIERCHSCGLCKSHCPAFQATGYEGDSPRAKVTLLREILHGRLEASSAFASKQMRQALELCLHCKRCAIECPLEVDVPRLTLAAKSLCRDQTKKFSRDRWLAEPLRLAKMRRSLGPVADRLASSRPGRRILETALGLHRDRLVPLIVQEKGTLASWQAGNQERSYSALDPSDLAPRTSGGPRVAIFEGCLARYYGQEVSRALVTLLERSGCQVILPPQKCCGLPKITYGDLASAHRDAQDNLEALEAAIDQGYRVITACPSCSLALRTEYPRWWDTPRARRVARNTFDAQEYLLLLYREDKRKGVWRERKEVVADHVPCHLRAQRLEGTGAELLGLIPGLTIRALGNRCCGMAGTFGLRRRTFGLSMEIGSALFREIAEARPDYVVTSCGACQWQIRQGTSLPAIHPLVLLQQSYLNP